MRYKVCNKLFLYDGENCMRRQEKCHGDNEKYLAANICHRLIRAVQIHFSRLKPRLMAYFANRILQSGGGKF